MTKKLLLYIIACYLKDEELDSINFDEKDLFYLANSLNVSTIVAYELATIKYNSPLLEKCIYKAVNRSVRIKQTLSNIENSFKDIDYVVIKGCSIAKYYIDPCLRYSADIDIIVDKKDYDKAYNILTNNLSYKVKQNAIHEVTFISKESIDVDFHKTFLFNKPEYEKVFADIDFSNHELDDNYKYLYHITHGAVHFVMGQLDLRFFIDLFYLRNCLLDRYFINSKLYELGLMTFDISLNSYLDSLLGLKEYSELDTKIENYIFDYAKDLGAKNRVGNNSGTFRYFFRHIFPPFVIMKGKYNNLKKYPFLLPFYYIKRIIDTITSNRLRYVLSEIKSGVKGHYNDLINELKISSYNG